MADKRGRIFRPPVQPLGNNIDIGSIMSLSVDGNTKQLALPKVNNYCLSENDDGDLVCTVLYKSEVCSVINSITASL